MRKLHHEPSSLRPSDTLGTVRRVYVFALIAALSGVGGPGVVSAQPPADSVPDGSDVPAEPGDPDSPDEGVGDDGATPVTLPLIPVPTGCTAPPMPHIVFVGTVEDRDFRTVRFEIDTIRAGRADPFANDDLIDVRYGLDAQYLDDDGTYLVSAVVDPDLGLLISRTTEEVQNFGGDEVIGVSETDANCPLYEDTVRTLHVDGTEIDGGVLDPLEGSRVRILGAFLVPLGAAVGVIFLLAMFRLSIAGLYHTIVDSGRRRFG